jgi:hypothetical protein
MRRYFRAYPAGQARDFEAAERNFTLALGGLAPDDPMRVDVSFCLGAIRIADHEGRCGRPCPVAAELPPIVSLLAVAGARNDAPAKQLYPYAMTVDKLYDHTHDSADIELAIAWLRRVAGHRDVSPQDRRRALISLAIQLANLGTARRAMDRSGESRDAFDAAISQFEQVIAELDRPGRRKDKTRDEDLDVMVVIARKLMTVMTASYRLRSYALGRCGVLLFQHITRRIGDPWDHALNAAILAMRPGPIHAALAEVPGLDADIGAAIEALVQAVRLDDDVEHRQPMFTAALCGAYALRYLARPGGDDLPEFGRLGRIVLGHPHIAASYRRFCGELLLVVLLQQLDQLRAGLGTYSRDAVRLSPSADDDLDTLIGLLAGFAADEVTLAPTLAAILAEAEIIRSEGDLSDEELGAAYGRSRDVADDTANVPAAHAVLLFRASVIGAEWVRRGTARPGVARQVAAGFREAQRELPATHPVAKEIAVRAAAFDRTGDKTAGTSVSIDKATAEPVPLGLELFDMRALASLGVASHGRLAIPAGRAAEVAEALLARSPRAAVQRAAAQSVLALALCTSWLRERTHADLARSLGYLRTAISLLAETHPLRARLTELLARMLLDRAQVGGDHADVDAALALLEGLSARVGTEPDPADLNELLAAAWPAKLGELLTAAPVRRPGQADGASSYRLDLEAAIGSGLMLRGILADGTAEELEIRSPLGNKDLWSAVDALRQVAFRLPSGDDRRLDVRSDLGLALLAVGRDQDVHLQAARQTLRETASAAGRSVHPRRAAIFLRAAVALAVNTQADYDPSSIDEEIDLLTQAVSVAGLDAFGERSRCLYGLGCTLLLRYSHTREVADVHLAIAHLEEARAGLEPFPGDPFMVPLLRALAWAHRRDADRQEKTGGLRLPQHRSRSAGRSVLYGHAQAVLLQSGSRHSLTAARPTGLDALRLAGWCLADGKLESAVEALELGRALVLHAATVAADIPGLLREAGRPELAAEWDDQVVASGRKDAPNIADIPSDLRRRVLAALRNGAAEQRLLAAPTVAQIADALHAAHMDRLVYLIPASEEISGRALVVGADGMVDEFGLPDLSAGPGSEVGRFTGAHHELREAAGLAGIPAAKLFKNELEKLCEWAWRVAIGPLLAQLPTAASRPPRLVLAPIGVLGIVPWHAAQHGQPGQVRYACGDAIFAVCASARQFIDAVVRPRLRADAGSAIFVANPGGDLPWSQREAEAICPALYPGAIYLGKSDQTMVRGPGSPDEVLACLSPQGLDGVVPAVLHLGCHARASDSPEESWLQLAGGENLPVRHILAQARTRARDLPGGLVILAACTSDLTVSDYDEALTLSSAFLAAGATGVVGSRWEVSDLYTALLMFMFHQHLVNNPADDPADALRAAQLWMLDPQRKIPAETPPVLATQARRSAASGPQAWAAFTYHGQ